MPGGQYLNKMSPLLRSYFLFKISLANQINIMDEREPESTMIYHSSSFNVDYT